MMNVENHIMAFFTKNKIKFFAPIYMAWATSHICPVQAHDTIASPVNPKNSPLMPEQTGVNLDIKSKFKWRDLLKQYDGEEGNNNIHSSLYWDKNLPNDSKSKLRDTQLGLELFNNSFEYANEILVLPDTEFRSGLEEIAAFRDVIIQGNGLGNLFLADWSNRLTSSIVQIRMIRGNKAGIAKARANFSLVRPIWKDVAHLKETLNLEFGMDLQKALKLETRPKTRLSPYLDANDYFSLYNPTGSEIKYIEKNIIKKNVTEPFSDESTKRSEWDDLVRFFLLLKLNVYTARMDLYEDPYIFCRTSHMLENDPVLLAQSPDKRPVSFRYRVTTKIPSKLLNQTFGCSIPQDYFLGKFGSGHVASFWNRTATKRTFLTTSKTLKDRTRLYVF